MRIRILAVGTRMPGWVSDGVNEYLKRLPREMNASFEEIAPARRQGQSADRLADLEAGAIERQLDSRDRVIALDVAGTLVSTEAIADALGDWAMNGDPVALVIGGADGLAPALLNRAEARWSLGRITLPHPLVRVVLAEQLYRAWSITANHPYHRA